MLKLGGQALPPLVMAALQVKPAAGLHHDAFHLIALAGYENGMGTTVATLERIPIALERAGIVFVPEDATGGPGVRHPRPVPRPSRRQSGRQ
jgi:hypothetical protein